MAQVPIALQLYTVRDEAATDFAGTARRVARLGYDGVEFAGTGGLSAAEMADLLAETGLRPAGSHVALGLLEADLDSVIAFHRAIGNRFVGVPVLPPEMRSLEGFRRVAATLNRLGATLRDAGLALYYHHHAFEVDPVDGTTGWDILVGETDPDLVVLETDVYWSVYAGRDPAEVIRAASGRFPLVHLKDMVGEGEGRTFAEVGAGRIDFAPIFRASEAQGVEWYIVEQDRCARPSMESARISITNLKGAMGKGG